MITYRTSTLVRSVAGLALLGAIATGCTVHHPQPTSGTGKPTPPAVSHSGSTTPRAPATPPPTHHRATTPPAPRPAPTTPPAPRPAPTTANPIPQDNGGDRDADNNGGPDDGDGDI